MFRALSCLIVLLVMGAGAAHAAGPLGSLKASELWELQTLIGDATAEAAKCRDGTCPKTDCAATSALAGSAAELLALARGLAPHLQAAREDRRKLFFAASKKIKDDALRNDTLQGALRTEKFFSDVAQLTLAMTSLVDGVFEIGGQVRELKAIAGRAGNPLAGDAARKAAIEDEIFSRKLFDRLSDVKDAGDGVSKAARGRPGQPMDKLLETMMSLNSLTLDMEETWTKVIKERSEIIKVVDGKEAIDVARLQSAVKLLARVALAWADSFQDEWQAELEDLAQTYPEEVAFYETSFRDFLDVVEFDAALTRLGGTIDGAGALQELLDAIAECACGADVKATFKPPQFSGYGEALKYYGELVAGSVRKARSAAAAFKVDDVKTPVKVWQRVTVPYDPQDEVMTYFRGPVCALQDGRIGIFKAEAPSGDGSGALQVQPTLPASGGRWPEGDPGKLGEGVLTFIAPDEPGPYSARFLPGKLLESKAQAAFSVRGDEFRIVKVDEQRKAWAAGIKATWINLDITFEGKTVKAPFSVTIDWVACPSNAVCERNTRPAKVIGDNKVHAERVFFCAPGVPNAPKSQGIDVVLNASGRSTEIFSYVIGC